PPRHLHSFPTRRSSDLLAAAGVERCDGGGDDGAVASGGGDRGHAALVREGPHRDREMTRFAAHRGGAALWPENSLLAFRQALALESDLVEFDVHQTADGALVVIHDPTLDRTTDTTGPVAARSAAEVGRPRLKGP